MFERFTDRARRVVVLAQDEARFLDHGYIGTEHILLGLIHEGDGVAAKVLAEMGISLDAVRARVVGIVGKGDGAPSGHIPFTPRSKKVLELALREALQLGHNYIGTEHILLGILREGNGLAAEVLVELGADLQTARDQVIRMIGPRPGVRGRAYPEMARLMTTPAAATVAGQARRLAQGARVGSQHYLLGLLGEERSLAAKVLTSLGVTREAVEAKLEELDAAGTTDESPDDAGARRMSLRIEAERLVLEVDDPELAAKLGPAAAGGVDVRTISGADPEARTAAFPELYAAFGRTVDALARRLALRTTPFAPMAWDPSVHAAAYNVVTSTGGLSRQLNVAPGIDPGAMRAWLRRWLEAERATLVGYAPPGGACSMLLVVDRAGDGFRIFSFGLGDTGGAEIVPTDELIDAALEGLAAAA
jgi:ATP-dependent Clp protease ATP-binding subunit ClpA